jgi:putative ABC transport system permease protein
MLWSLAFRNIRTHPSRAVLNTIGIALGVGLIFAVLSLSKTLVSSFDDLYATVYGKVDLIVSGANGEGTVPASALQTVRRTAGVKVATADVSAVLSLVKHGRTSTSQSDQLNTTGIDPSQPDLTGSQLAAGRRVKSGNEITVDQEFAHGNHLGVGQEISLATPVGVRRFLIVGIVRFGSGLQYGGQGFASIPLQVARHDFSLPRGYSEIDLQVASSTSVATVERRLRGELSHTLEISPPSQKTSAVNDQLQAFNAILDFFAAMAAFVGAFLILNSFNMTVAQRLREIGVLRTLGGSRRQITRSLLIEALLLALIGSPLGLLVGFGLAHLMATLVQSFNYPIGRLRLPPDAFVVAPVAGVAATVLGALRPALAAGRIPPIRAVLAEHSAGRPRRAPRILIGSVLVVAGLAGVFRFSSSPTQPLAVALMGVIGIVALLGGVVLVAPLIVPVLVRVLSQPIRLLAPIEGRIAADSTRSNPLRTASTASGLMIGIALVAAIGSLGASLIGSISEELNKQLLTDFTVQPSNFRQGGAGSATTIDERALRQVGALKGVSLATGVRLLLVPKGYDGVDYQALGYAPATRSRVTTVDFVGQSAAAVYAKVAQGEITVGGQLRERNHVKAGDLVTLKGPSKSLRLRVAGVESGSSLENQSIGMSLSTFTSLTGISGYTQIDVLARSSGERAHVGQELSSLIGGEYPNLQVLSNAAIKSQVESQTNQIFSIFYAIMVVAVIVSLLGVVNTMLISVLERTREIGVLRAIGSTRWRIRRIVSDEGVLLTVAGAAMGLVVGLAIGYVYVRGVGSELSGVYFRPPVLIILIVALLSVIAGLLAAILPARRAALMNIIEAISYE